MAFKLFVPNTGPGYVYCAECSGHIGENQCDCGGFEGMADSACHACMIVICNFSPQPPCWSDPSDCGKGVPGIWIHFLSPSGGL